MRRMLAAGDSGDQYLPGEGRGVTYVSRLQSVQAAISSQIEAMKAAVRHSHCRCVFDLGRAVCVHVCGGRFISRHPTPTPSVPASLALTALCATHGSVVVTSNLSVVMAS
jgi:hypothetical protein